MKAGSERGGKGNISFWETHNNQLFFLKNSTNEPNSHIVCVCVRPLVQDDISVCVSARVVSCLTVCVFRVSGQIIME